MGKIVALPLVLIFLMSSCVIFTEPALSYSDVSDNSWITKAPMHTARAYLGVAVVNGKIYAIGGDTGSAIGNGPGPGVGTAHVTPVVDTNEEYDPATDKWTKMTPMPTARAQFGTAVYQNTIFCIGGYITKYNSTNANEMYDPATNSWYTKAAMPTPAAGVQASTVDGKIYVIGSGVNYVYNPLTDSWASKTPPPSEIEDRYSAVVGSKISFIGYLADLSNVVQTYDISNDNWSVLTNAPAYPQSENGCGVTSGVYAPRQISYFDYAATYLFNLTNNSWTVGVPMPTARTCVGVAVVNDTFYVIGGRFGIWTYITMMDASAVTEQYIPVGYGTIRPVVSVFSPENKTYNVSSVPLTFTVDKPTSWMGYSLDEQDNVSITGNTTLTDVPNGAHNLTVYAEYTEGSIGASETIAFTIAKPEREPFPTTLVITASGASAVAIGIGMLVYFRRRKKLEATK